MQGTRLRMDPASVYKELSDEEVLTLRHHGAAIKALVRSGYGTSQPPPAPKTVAPPVEVPAPKCPYCGQSPCVGPDHPHFDVLHYTDPVEVKRRDAALTREMYLGLGKDSPYL
jgi:hypothetical protein